MYNGNTEWQITKNYLPDREGFSKMKRVAIITSSDTGYRENVRFKQTCDPSRLLRRMDMRLCLKMFCRMTEKMLSEKMAEIADSGTAELIPTTGGTGFSPRDITPEATEDIIDRRVPGIPEAMRAYSMTITKRAMLSRSRQVPKNTDHQSSGKSESCKESTEYIDALGHGIEIMTGKQGTAR